MAAISVVRVYPIVATGYLGLKLGEALFSDGQRLRFRVLSRDPCCTVRLLSPAPLPDHQRAIEDWLAKNARSAA